jgi:hypothetical protein
LVELKQLTSIWGEKTSASVKDLQSLTGKLNFAMQVVRPGRPYLGRIINQIRHLLQLSNNHLTQFPLPFTVKEDIKWWNNFIEKWNGVSIMYDVEWTSSIKLELYTDACMSGMGARYGNEWFEMKWTIDHLNVAKRKIRVSMPFLELFALVSAAATWGKHWCGKRIIFYCDCEPVVKSLIKMSSRHPSMQHLIRLLSSYAAEYNFDFKCTHIAGVKNVAADVLSRDGDCVQFRAECPSANPLPTPITHLPLRC